MQHLRPGAYGRVMSDAGTEVSQVDEAPEPPVGSGATTSTKATSHGWRVGLSIFLAIAVGVLAPLTVVGAWVKAQVNSTDAWVNTV